MRQLKGLIYLGIKRMVRSDLRKYVSMLGGATLALTGGLTYPGCARADADDAVATCVSRPTTFDGTEPLTYARVGKLPESVTLYDKHPIQCADRSGAECAVVGHLNPDDIVSIGKECDGWAFLQFIGETSVTVGWAKTSFLALDRYKSWVPSEHSAGRYRFTLTMGQGIPVCEAYLQRLNRTDFQKQDPFRPESSPPYCGRPEVESVPGFAVLNRVPLGATEINRLTGSVFNFTHPNDKLPTCQFKQGSHVCESTWPLPETQEELSRGALFVWRYTPRVDVSNDGRFNEVIVWQGSGAGYADAPCGMIGLKFSPNAGFRQSQIAYVLTSDESVVDASRTERLFGHPFKAYVGTGMDGKEFKITTTFRPLGTSIGIFKYRDTYYIDTFFDIWGDLENQRRGDFLLANTLAVIVHKGTSTREICEFDVSGQDYPVAPPWSLNP